MKNPIKLFLIFACTLFLSVSLKAGEVVYTATMSGIDCSGCKKKISMSLSKIKGVKRIRIAKLTSGQHKLTVVTDGSTAISREKAVSTIKNAEHYKILSWSQG